jgi:hypothetical protein
MKDEMANILIEIGYTIRYPDWTGMGFHESKVVNIYQAGEPPLEIYTLENGAELDELCFTEGARIIGTV